MIILTPETRTDNSEITQSDVNQAIEASSCQCVDFRRRGGDQPRAVQESASRAGRRSRPGSSARPPSCACVPCLRRFRDAGSPPGEGREPR